MTTIDLGGVPFSDFATSGWVFQGLTDWRGQTSDKVPVNERPQGHGAFTTTKSWRSSRAISFKAVYLGDTAAEVQVAVDTLAAVGAEGPVTMTVAEDSGTSWRTVTVETSAYTDHNGDPSGEVVVDLIARDSRRYADASWITTTPPVDGAGVTWPLIWPLIWPGGGVDGRVALVNSGRAPSSPVFRLNGGFASAQITCAETGGRVGFAQPVPVGSTVTIDYGTRRAVIDGQDVSRWLRFREWDVVPSQSTRRFQFDVTGASGSPTMDGRVFSAWW